MARLEKLIIENFPPSWQVWTRKVDSDYQFSVLGHEELFERKAMAVIIISDDRQNVDFTLGQSVTPLQKSLILDALTEIRRRLPQIPFPKETSCLPPDDPQQPL
jgi:hypothetical protein